MNYNNNIATLSKAMDIPYKMNNFYKPKKFKKSINKFTNITNINKFTNINNVNRHRFNYQNRVKIAQRFVKY